MEEAATEQALSQADISRRAGVSSGMVSHVFNGKRVPGLDLASKLAEAMGLTLDEFHRRLKNGELKAGG